jgi:hypothetical protein
MLLLRSEDLTEGKRPGLTIWQRRRTPASSPDMIVAWEDLLLIRPQIRFPEGCDPRSESSWREGVRVAWSPRLWRYLYLSPVPVPDLQPAEALGRQGGFEVHLRQREKGGGPLQVVDGARFFGHLSSASATRVEAAVGPVRWRLVSLAGRPTLLGWGSQRARLRVVAAILP